MEKDTKSDKELQQRNKLLQQLSWDYGISAEEIQAVLTGKKKYAGHYTKKDLFQKMLETYSWFTILQLFSPYEIKKLLTPDLINRLRMHSLRKKYEFIRRRLHQVV
ncbi:MAG: hypothetical protein ACOC80_16995 [Petrotogales bacterium]|nr:hypothetical protein [Candidatus Cloacimonadota bacterium]